VKYRAIPQLKGRARQRVDRGIAAGLLAIMVLINLLFWGPLPVAWLWVGSQVDYQTGSTFLGIVVAFIGLLFSLLVGLMVMRQIDLLWILARRASGVDQRQGTVARVFAVSAIVGAILFFTWLMLIAGPGSSLGPAQSN
jgi:divalent metal cation (Fe/Co/Zn/Cd) transporter